MIPHYSTRPLPGKPKAWDPDCELVINIKSQGKWACYKARKYYCDALMREGMVAFQGRADEWGKAVPRLPTSSSDHGHGIVLNKGAQVIGAPGNYGMMVIDYDAKQAMSIQGYSDAFSVPQYRDEWFGRETRNGGQSKNPYPGWLESMVREGHLTHAEYEGRKIPLRITARDAKGIEKQITDQAVHAFGLEQGATAANEHYRLMFCFEPEGWTLAEHVGCAVQTLPLLLGQLSPHEKEAWMAFADGYVSEREGEPMKALLRANHLEQALPVRLVEPDEPTAPGKRRGLPRL